MSAFMCGNDHLGYLVAAGFKYHPRWLGPKGNGDWREMRPGDYDEGERVGQVLADQNHASLCARYPAHFSHEDGPAFTEKDIPLYLDIDSVQVLKSCHCYAYQACEDPAWEESEAYRYVQALEAQAMRKVPGYDDAEWGPPARKRELLRI